MNWVTKATSGLFARVPEFDVDQRGTATRTCPDHLGVRNVPGGACRGGNPCRSVPSELPHPPARPRTPAPGGGGKDRRGRGSDGGGAPRLGPALTERILASLPACGPTAADGSTERAGPAHPPARRAIIDGIRQRLAA
ncbi:MULTISPECIES: hypothetical protein [Nocardiopsis]|uniref:hypothetical protein n=1 Tax=Nocardiopsis TaxID=2013 RepID=UPI0014784A0C|nr:MULTISPECIES: hypothetical protein [Nocardiopsis]